MASGRITIVPASGDSFGCGRQIDIVATSSPGTPLHTPLSSASFWDYVSMMLSNRDSLDHKVTIQFGGTLAADSIVVIVPAFGEWPIEERCITGANAVLAFCDAASVVSAHVQVQRAQVAP